jgi:hypothetical protein
MTVTEQALLQTLLELEETVRAMRVLQPKPDLMPIFKRIDELTAQLPKGTDRTLLHYLHMKSFEKARLWLQARQAAPDR